MSDEVGLTHYARAEAVVKRIEKKPWRTPGLGISFAVTGFFSCAGIKAFDRKGR